jgi:3-oxo-5-alpha-steroid 4-dehydrogenase 1
MIGPETFRWVLVAWIGLATATSVALLLVVAPYGRHRRAGWGPVLPARIGWFAMELPALLTLPVLVAASPRGIDLVTAAVVALWLVHYVHRTVVSPLRMPRDAAPIPLVIVAMGLAFNLANGWLQAEWLAHLAPERSPAALARPAFLLGTAVFVAGMTLNWRSDAALRRLRAASRGGYGVPRGGAFELVSCPNYLGEIVEWTGWAIASASPAAAAFAVWTAANLAPRALAHHRWYRATFPEYPRARKAIVPFVL